MSITATAGTGSRRLLKCHLSILPPVHLRHRGNAAVLEPLSQATPDKEVQPGEPARQFLHARGREVVVMVVADEDSVKLWNITGRASGGCESFWSQNAPTLFKDRVEQCAETRWKLDKIGRMSHPGRAEVGATATGGSKRWPDSWNLGV